MPVGNPILLLVERDTFGGDFTYPLARAVQPSDRKVQVGVCTGRRWDMQGQPHSEVTTGSMYTSTDKATERLYRNKKKSGESEDDRRSGRN